MGLDIYIDTSTYILHSIVVISAVKVVGLKSIDGG